MLFQQLSGKFEESGPWLARSLQIQPNLIAHRRRSEAERLEVAVSAGSSLVRFSNLRKQQMSQSVQPGKPKSRFR